MFVQNGTIYLCGRSDGDGSRSFSGSVSHVGLWDTVLSATQILNLYKTVVVNTASSFASPSGGPAGAPQAAGPSSRIAAAPGGAAAAPALQLPAASPVSHPSALLGSGYVTNKPGGSLLVAPSRVVS